MSSVAQFTTGRAKEIVRKLARFHAPGSKADKPATAGSPGDRVGQAVYGAMGKLGASAAALSIVAATLAPQAAQAHVLESVFDSPPAMTEVLGGLEAAMNDARTKQADRILDPMEKAVEASPGDFTNEIPMPHGPSDGVYPQGELGDQMKMADIVKDIYSLKDGGQVYSDADRLLEVQKKIFDLTFDTVDVLPDVSRLYGDFKGHNITVQGLITKGVENWTEEDRVQFDQIEESVTALHQVRAPEMLRTDQSSEKPFNLQGQVDLHEAEREMVPHLQVHLLRLDIQILGGGLHDSTTPHVMLKKQLEVLDQIAEAESFTSHHAEIVRKIAEETGFGGPDNDVPSQIRADFEDELAGPKM